MTCFSRPSGRIFDFLCFNLLYGPDLDSTIGFATLEHIVCESLNFIERLPMLLLLMDAARVRLKQCDLCNEKQFQLLWI